MNKQKIITIFQYVNYAIGLFLLFTGKPIKAILLYGSTTAIIHIYNKKVENGKTTRNTR